MKPKRIHKLLVDWLMLVLLMVQMGRHLWGNIFHEWTGAGMFALFIVHQAFNISWYKTVFRGQYTPYRLLRLTINVLAFAAMAGLMVSGIMLSQQVFAFLPVSGGASFARLLHMLSSYWGFVLMALHLGLNWNGVARWHWEMAGGGAAGSIRSSFAFGAASNLAGLAVAGYGAWAFIRRDLLTYLFVQTRFVFFDFQESRSLFYLDYLAMAGFFVWVGHNAGKLSRTPLAGRQKMATGLSAPAAGRKMRGVE